MYKVTTTIGALILATLVLSSCGSPPLAQQPSVEESTQTPAPQQAGPTPTSLPMTTPTVTRSGDRLYVRDGYNSPTQHLAIVDAASGARERELPLGAEAPDWSILYTTQPSGEETIVRALDVATGRPVREITLRGQYDLPTISMDGRPGGLSPDGRWLVLSAPWSDQEIATLQRDSRWRSRFVVLDAAFAQPPKLIEVDGNFWFDAISNDGTSLYLIENLPPDRPEQYLVRVYDLVQGILEPGAIADKTDTEVMSGFRHSAIPSPDGQWLYSLYLNNTKGPFIHALNLAQRFAVCIDLPSQWADASEKQLLWSFIMTPDGKTLYIANGALGVVGEVDTAGLSVRRTAKLPAPTAAAPNLLARFAQWLVPVAEAKRILVGGATLSPDGRMLFVLDDKGFFAINTSDLSLRGRYLRDWTLDSLAVSPDGARLYAVSAERSQVLQLDPATGAVEAQMTVSGGPWGVLRVEARR